MPRVALLSALAAVFTLTLAGAVEPPMAVTTAAVAVRSDSQVELGRRWFAASCETCHALDEISSDDFKAKWSGRTAFDLFDQISRTMPEAEPGTLPRRAYVDIVAYLMRQNGDTAEVALADDDSVMSATVLRFTPSSHSRR
jgi:mono/diheme cytochrome c family protein